jgi:hypothetical protein
MFTQNLVEVTNVWGSIEIQNYNYEIQFLGPNLVNKNALRFVPRWNLINKSDLAFFTAWPLVEILNRDFVQ